MVWVALILLVKGTLDSFFRSYLDYVLQVSMKKKRNSGTIVISYSDLVLEIFKFLTNLVL